MKYNKNIISEGTYGTIYISKKNDMVVYKKYKYGSICASSIKEIVAYKLLANSLNFLHIIKEKNNKLYLPRYAFTLNDIDTRNITLIDKIKIMYSLLQSLKELHTHNIIHRDIKPENIVYNSPDDVKIIDFGLCKFGIFNKLVSTPLIHEVYSPYWRSPEITQEKYYNSKSDIWAMAIVFIRLLVFVSEKHYAKLLHKLPDKKSMIRFFKLTFNRASDPKRYSDLVDQDIILDLIVNMLNIDLHERYDADQCLKHELFKKIDIKDDNTITPLKVFQYADIASRKEDLKHIYKLGIEHDLSYQIIMHAFMLYDNIYKLYPEYKCSVITFVCVRISALLYDYDVMSFNFIIDNKIIYDVLSMLNYDIYYDDFITTYNDRTLILKIFKDYINKLL